MKDGGKDGRRAMWETVRADLSEAASDTAVADAFRIPVWIIAEQRIKSDQNGDTWTASEGSYSS